MFDAFRNEMAKDKYFYEDLMSHSLRLDQKDKDQKAQIQYQKYKVQELQDKNQKLEETIIELKNQIKENEDNI